MIDPILILFISLLLLYYYYCYKYFNNQFVYEIGLKSQWRLTTCHKAFVVSGTHVHFGCRGDQSPSGQQSKQWEPQTSVSSLLGLISVAYPLYCLDRISFYTFHPPQDNTCGFRKASTTDRDYNLING